MTLPNATTYHMIPHRHLSPGEERAILDILTVAYAQQFDLFEEYYDNYTHVLMVVGATLAAHVGWEQRTLIIGDHLPLRIAYLESLATQPHLTGLGFGSAAMNIVARQIQDCELGVLSAETPEFHARLGWETWPGPILVRSETGLVPSTDGPLMILRTPHTPAWLDTGEPILAPWSDLEETFQGTLV